jgi:nitrite reductase (NADH) small subunit
MLVVTLAVSGPGNCVEVGGIPYVFARTWLGSFMMAAQCAHRGGPLHLGDLDEDGRRLVCPWHGSRTSILRIIKTAVPAVRTGNTVTAVFPVPATAERVLTHRPLSAALNWSSDGR